jgi:PadR family transcriptional regulator
LNPSKPFAGAVLMGLPAARLAASEDGSLAPRSHPSKSPLTRGEALIEFYTVLIMGSLGMPPRELPGAFEQMVLLALVRLKDEGYGMTVRREIARRASRRVSLGAVYATLDRLERKGYVTSSSFMPPRAERGRARRFFSLSPSGLDALRLSLQMLDGMRRGLRRRVQAPGPHEGT